MGDWDFEAITAKWQQRWWDAGIQHAHGPDDSAGGGTAPSRGEAPGRPQAAPGGLSAKRSEARKPPFFIHFAYPGISGYLHVGHMRGFTYTDVFARYKRMTGHDVLFPAGFHASGIPAVAFAAEVRRGEKTEYLRANGYEGPIEALSEPRAVVDYFARVYTDDYWKKFGFLIDERRNVTTIDPGYMRFIQWQFRRLNDKGYLIQKPHYAPFCPVAGPVAVDKSETDIKQGGAAEVLEFVAMRFTLPAGTLAPEPVVVPCATLRPETIYGVTNLWIHPDAEYNLVRVWRDGAVADSDPSELWLVSAQGQRKLEWQFERAEPTGQTVPGHRVVGETVTTPVTNVPVPVVAATFVDPMVATGIVMSVPGHAPFDYAAYLDAGLVVKLGEPPQIVKVEGYPGLPAKLACEKHRVRSQNDKVALTAATDELYSDEFNKGVLTEKCGPYAGKRIKGIKDQVKADFLAAGHARVLRQFSEVVISRAGQIVDIKRIPDQDFIHYADKAWTEKAKAHVAGTLASSTEGQGMSVFPQRYKEELPNVLDWFGDRACVRRGAWLGTEFPFKPGWIIEPIADSTFYPWFYVVSRYLKSEWNPQPAMGGLPLDGLTDAFFDFILNGKGTPPSGGTGQIWQAVRADISHFGPVGINLGGKEHQTVHFPVYIMNMVALLDDPKLWPRGIFVNWWVTQQAGAKISKSKGGAEPIPGAAKRYGVDAMRLYYCHVGSPHVDIEWDPDLVFTYRSRIERIARVADEALATSGGAGPMDAWLRAAVDGSLGAGQAAYEAYDLRTAATELCYTVPDLLRWYARRGGANADLLRETVRAWAQALCPIVPHLAEEMHERAGGQGLCSASQLATRGTPDEAALAAEEYLRLVLDDIATVRKLANLDAAKSLVLFATPAWKRDLLALALRMAKEANGKFPMGDYMKAAMADPAVRALGKEAQNFTGKVVGAVNQMTPAQRALMAAQADEATILRQASAFLASELGVTVQVFAADDAGAPEHPKRNVASPFKPGIALS